MQANNNPNNSHADAQRVEPTRDILQEERKVFDNIHGFIRFEKRLWYFIDTAEFQKLRYIKQLGVLSYVFPGATHTRFEHCLGTGHLAKTFISLLIKNHPQRYTKPTQKQTKELKESAIFTVTLAGIMHDIGHGPFSHTFDSSIVKTKVLQKNSTREGKQWKHQIGSELIFRHIVEKYGLIKKRVIQQDQVERVVNLIEGTSDGVREWEFQLISNKTTGIDVDKLDYFRRDAFYLGAKGVLIDHELLMNEARILYDQKAQKPHYCIGYPSKYALQVNDIFYSRYKLYKTYYLNNISKGIQFMIMDVLKLVEPIFQFNKICRYIKQSQYWIDRYVQLTDSILERVEWLDENDSKYNQNLRNNILEAKAILRRLKQRKIYKFVREVQTQITVERIETDKKNKDILKTIFNTENISKYIHQETKVPISEFHIAVTQAGYGMKNINPLNKVKFFRKENSINPQERYRPIDQGDFRAQNISILYTKAFAQRYAKLFVKNVEQKDLQNVKEINLAFHKYFQYWQKQCQKEKDYQNLFHHLNMGRTSFIPTRIMNQNRVIIHSYQQPSNPENTQFYP